MLDELGPLLKNLPPRTASALVQAMNRCAAHLGVGSDWVQRWIGFTVVADALGRYAPHGQPKFEMKGGAAIELRLGRPTPVGQTPKSESQPTARARATRDLDAAFLGTMDEMETAVRTALAEPRHPFTFRVELEEPTPEFMRRFRIRVAYREERFGEVSERSFSNVKLEVSAYEGRHREPDQVPAFSLTPFGFEGPERIPCIPLSKQVAQKLHAIRAKHPWPPEVVAHPHWIGPLEAYAREMGLAQTDAGEIVRHVSEYVARVAAAGSTDRPAS